MIQTARCKLNALQSDDFDNVIKIRTSAEVRQFLGGPVKRNLIKSRFVKMLEPDVYTHQWVIRSKADNSFIGLITLNKHHDGKNTELSYELLPEWWGQGYATEAVGAILGHALQNLGLPRVIAETQKANIASRRLLERLGMYPEKTVERFGAEQVIYATQGAKKCY